MYEFVLFFFVGATIGRPLKIEIHLGRAMHAPTMDFIIFRRAIHESPVVANDNRLSWTSRTVKL
jgi:hypothetical protein